MPDSKEKMPGYRWPLPLARLHWIGRGRRLAKAELERAKAYWPLVRADSRIGYESSNHYFFVPRDVLEKVLSCRRILDRQIAIDAAER